MKKNKTFDCVAMKKKGGALIYNQTKNMTFEEKVEYWEKRSEEFKQLREELQSHQPTNS